MQIAGEGEGVRTGGEVISATEHSQVDKEDTQSKVSHDRWGEQSVRD